MLTPYLGRISAGENLTQEEMAAVMSEVMAGRCSENEIALLLTALKAKGETADEIAGAAQVMRRNMTPIRSTRQGIVDTCGTGGVGSAVVQFAKAAGATVITTAGSPEKAADCLQLGAAHVIEYRTQDIDQRFAEITAATGPIHLWFETLRTPTLDRCISLMAPRGRMIFMAGRDARPEFPVGPFYVKDLRAFGFAMFNASPAEQRVAAIALNTMLTDGCYKPLIGARLPLAEAAKAHQLQEDNTLNFAGTLTGKIVLKP